MKLLSLLSIVACLSMTLRGQSSPFQLKDMDTIKYYSFHSRFPTGKIAKEFEHELVFNDKDWKQVFQNKEDTPLFTKDLDSIKSRILPIINDEQDGPATFCGFRPHHFMRLYNAQKKVIAEMDLCFECGDIEFKSSLFNMNCPDFKKCRPRYGATDYFSDDVLVRLMKRTGIRRWGVYKSNDEEKEKE